MIGIKPKKKKEADVGVPIEPPMEGQASIFGKVTERNIFTNQVTDAVDASVDLIQNNIKIASIMTSIDGTFSIGSINAGTNYSVEISKDSAYVSPEFPLASNQRKQIIIELTTTNFS